MKIIKKQSQEYLDWLKRRNRKILKKRAKFKKTKKNKKKKLQEVDYRHGDKFIAPQNFSIINNPEETNFFLNSIIKHRTKQKRNAVFNLDFSNVKDVTVDAIMHIIAIITDSRTTYYRTYNYTFEGSLPKDKIAQKVFKQSGFLDYVNYDGDEIKPQSDKIRIIQGKKILPDIAKQVCIFIQERCRLDKKDTNPLYEVLIELMGNTNQHAYREDERRGKTQRQWYLFAEERDDSVSFVFLDTGVGIPQTVHKQLLERVRMSDADYIKSALNGDFRSETKQRDRGKGLPQINECCRKGILEEVYVIAGKGICKINVDNERNHYSVVELNNKMKGTLFGWKIIKRGGN